MSLTTKLKRNTEYEQKDKTQHFVGHPWRGFAENEGESHQGCAISDNSNDRQHSFPAKQ
jgi:hypothetical protein